MQKGKDTVALVCYDLKKIYGFSDVNYKKVVSFYF